MIKGEIMKECNEFIELSKWTHKVDIKRDYKEYIDPILYVTNYLRNKRELRGAKTR